MPKHQGHDDVTLSDICRKVQEEVIKLKHTYVEKKEMIIKKLDGH